MVSLTPLQYRTDAATDLSRVEEALREAAKTDDDFLTEVASHLIPAGGEAAEARLSHCVRFGFGSCRRRVRQVD